MSRSSRAIHCFLCAAVLPLCAMQSAWASAVTISAVTDIAKGETGAVQAKQLPVADAQSPMRTRTTLQPVGMADDLSTKTDTELTALTAQWGNLNPGERRKLLAEVRGRMVANKKARRIIGVRVQRQYGRVVRKSDGSVVLQTRVVQIRPVDGVPRSRVTFGIGFEQRSKTRPVPPRDSLMPQAPGVTVSQQQTAPTEP